MRLARALRWSLVGMCSFCHTAYAAMPKAVEAIKVRGALHCGTHGDLEGFSLERPAGKWQGMDVDFCRALTAAIFGNPEQVRFIRLESSQRFLALRDGRIDVLARTTTWTFGREANEGALFAGILFYDGQGFMSRREAGIYSHKDLAGTSICVEANTTTHRNLQYFLKKNKIDAKIVVGSDSAKVLRDYKSGACAVVTGDLSGLHSDRYRMLVPREHYVFPDLISKEPLGPSVRNGDIGWFLAVRWCLYGLISAEEIGFTQSLAESGEWKNNLELKTAIDKANALGVKLGLRNDWFVMAVKTVGNYGEMFDRHLSKSRLRVRRGANRLWTQGGLQYSPPLQ